MHIVRRVILPVVVAAIAILAALQAASAYEVIDYSHSGVDPLVPGGTYSITATIGLGPDDPTDEWVEMEVQRPGSSTLVRTVGYPVDGVIQLSITLDVTDAETSDCASSAGILENYIQIRAENSETRMLANFVRSPCTLPFDSTLLVPPYVVEQICGPANDQITLPGQVSYLVSLQDLGWYGDFRLVEAVLESPYVFPPDFDPVYALEDFNTPCLIDVTPNVDLIQQTAVCGENNDTFTFEQEGVEFAIGEWTDNTNTISFTPAEGFYFPEETVATHPVTDQVTDCIITGELVSPVITAICDVNNDEITPAEGQPEGVNPEPVITDWTDGEATVTYSALDGFAFAPNATTSFTLTDEGIPCEEEPVGKQVTVLLNTSDGGSIAGTPYQVYTPLASMAQQSSFAEGVVDAENRILLQGLLPGEYRLVIAPEGYDPIDTTFAVTQVEGPQEITIDVAAIQLPETPAPSPTVEPTPAATVDSQPTQQPVSGLPQTGSGSGTNPLILGLAGVIAAAMAAALIGNRGIRIR